jgi:hypothetical protein
MFVSQSGGVWDTKGPAEFVGIFVDKFVADWDLKTCLPGVCDHFGLRKPSYFNEWVNIKKAYASFYQTVLWLLGCDMFDI